MRVRLQTDAGTLVGSVQLERLRSSLYELLDDDRAYLALWDVTWLCSSQCEEFLAIHKSTIRSVTLEAASGATAAGGTEA